MKTDRDFFCRKYKKTALYITGCAVLLLFYIQIFAETKQKNTKMFKI